MAIKKIVFVESPAKAKTIQRFVDKDTLVKATFGHIRDLPKTNLGVDTENDFEPKYIIPKKASPVVKELKSLVKGSELIYLATDPDREGEAIAWHLIHALGLDPEKVQRILFHEITNRAIQHALEHPGKVNDNLVDAQQARRVVDRLVGYSLSPLLWQKIYRGLSAGRVQSVALRLVTDREEEIGAFKSEEYWSLWATFLTADKQSFEAKLEHYKGKAIGKQPKHEVVLEAQKASEDKSWVILRRTVEQKQRHPKPPFTTSTLQQEASRKLRFSVKQTMMYAQRLYEGVTIKGDTVGLITYMRTDSVVLSDESITEARKTISDAYGAKFVPGEARRYTTKSKGAQEAHEAIRPTSFERSPSSLKSSLGVNEWKLYKLIWERALASQMVSADTESTHLEVGVKDSPELVVYGAHGVRIVFPGFLKVYEEGKDDDTALEGEFEGEQVLPNIKENDKVTLEQLEPKQHFTQPPPRYTEASLVRDMEKLGIGRPSTYAPTISTLLDRGYVLKEEGKFVPQEVGKIVIGLLKEQFPSIVDSAFTAQMEEDLDDIADGKKKWQVVVKNFYGPFHKLIETAEKSIDKKSLSEEATDETCPQCQKPLIIKLGRYGKFYACTGFPECRFTRPHEDQATEEKENKLIEGRVCPEDKGALVIRRGRFGSFIGCSNYPNCKFIEPIVKEIGMPCPKDKGAIIERRTKRGKMFWGCSNYPKCDFVAWDKPLPDPCPQCKGLLVEKKNEVACTQCTYTRPKPETGGGE